MTSITESEIAPACEKLGRLRAALEGVLFGQEALIELVVQLRRFLVLEEARRPNLASQCLGAGMRELVGQWESEHGYRPLLAESFSDPESHAGTVYTATNSTQAGTTKGFSQDHSDYYIPNGRPKKATVRVILDKGGDYLIGTKENTSKRLDAAIHALEGSPFLT